MTIRNGGTGIGADAFRNCTGLTAIQVDAGNQNYTAVDGVLFTKDMETLVAYPGGKQGSYTIPGSDAKIGMGAFRNCAGLTSVTFPDSISRITRGAFEGCANLKSVTLSDSTSSIEFEAFKNCTGLKDVYYGGTEEQWKAIEFEAYRGYIDPITLSTIHYNDPIPQPSTAAPSTQSVLLDGRDVTFYTYQIDGANYVKLRDLAYAINSNNYFKLRDLAYAINSNNYFKLRDLGRALGFNVSYIDGRIVIAPDEPYSDAQ